MAQAGVAETERPTGLVVRLQNGTELPLVIGPAGFKKLTGDRRTERAIRDLCDSGVIRTLPRPAGSGAHHRIPVAKALDDLGIQYEIVERTRVEPEQ